MSQKTSEPEVCQTLLDFVSEGTYPGSENIAVSEFPPSVLSKELELISEARQQVEVCLWDSIGFLVDCPVANSFLLTSVLGNRRK